MLIQAPFSSVPFLEGNPSVKEVQKILVSLGSSVTDRQSEHIDSGNGDRELRINQSPGGTGFSRKQEHVDFLAFASEKGAGRILNHQLALASFP